MGAPYAGPGNRFWWVLHETGLTPRRLEPGEFRDLPRYGIGLTDVAKYTSGPDSSLARADFDPAAVIGKVERYAPRILAFVGKRAAREVLGGPSPTAAGRPGSASATSGSCRRRPARHGERGQSSRGGGPP